MLSQNLPQGFKNSNPIREDAFQRSASPSPSVSTPQTAGLTLKFSGTSPTTPLLRVAMQMLHGSDSHILLQKSTFVTAWWLPGHWDSDFHMRLLPPSGKELYLTQHCFLASGMVPAHGKLLIKNIQINECKASILFIIVPVHFFLPSPERKKKTAGHSCGCPISTPQIQGRIEWGPFSTNPETSLHARAQGGWGMALGDLSAFLGWMEYVRRGKGTLNF